MDELKKAAEDYSNSLDYYHYTGDDPSIGFIAGAKWMQAQMEELKRLADNMYESAQYLTTDASQLRKAMEEYYNFINFKFLNW